MKATNRKISDSSMQPAPSLNKKSIPGPTSPSHFFIVFFFMIFRKPVSVDAMTKAGIYLCLATGASIFFDFVKVPSSYFSNKHNLINQMFVKWGWGWTFCTLSCYIIVSSFIFTAGKLSLIRSHLLRLIIGSICWYVCTGFFNFVENKTGQCHPANITIGESSMRPNDRRTCYKNGGIWFGFDISGHCFLMSMCNLWITEELRIMFYWQRLADILRPYEPNFTSDLSNGVSYIKLSRFSSEEINIMRSGFRRLTGTVKLIFVFAAFLSVLWDVMFLCTIIYFHNLPSKFIGTAFGILCWYVSYRYIFPSARTGNWCGFAPGIPGDCALDFMPKN